MKHSNLSGAERAEKILELIRSENSVNVNDLADLFEVSGATIRTDLTKLENSGEIIRTHGGAMLKSSLHREQSMDKRLHQGKKAEIARGALELVQDGDTILLDTGTTMVCFAQALAASPLKGLRVFTPDLTVAQILEEKESFELHLLGGRIRNGFHYCYGHQTVEELKKYNFEKLFLATSAISLTQGLTTSNNDLANLKAAMIQCSKNIILLADSSKLNRIDFLTFASISEIDVLVMDGDIPAAQLQKLNEQISRLLLI